MVKHTPVPGTPDVSIIVVTWNCAELALRCLTDVYASRFTRSIEVIVVDNASVDGTPDRIATVFPAVRLIVNGTNVGFARANNQAMRVAAGRTLILLNPDAFPSTPSTFQALLQAAESGGFAILGCRLIYPDGRHQVGDAGWRPTPWHVVVHSLGLSQLWPGAHGVFLVRPPATGAPIDVDWVCGACLLVTAEAVRLHGGFDESFFMYAEDVEFGCRLRRCGLRVGYLPSQAVIHLQGGTAADPASVSTRWLDSLAAVYRTMNGGRYWFIFRAATTTGFLMRAAAYRALSWLPKRQGLNNNARVMAHFARHAWQLTPKETGATDGRLLSS